MASFERVLVVKLADIGDAVLSLPAVQALQTALPLATIDVLTTEAGAHVFNLSPAVNRVMTLAKQQFDHIRGLISFSGIRDLAALTITLRTRRYDTVVLLHHLTTSFGARKFSALTRATGAPVVAGLENGRGHFLTHRATDYGFGEMSEWEYGLTVIQALGLEAEVTRPDIRVPEDTERTMKHRIRQILGEQRPYAVIHGEVGGFSPARGWRDGHFAAVARHLVTTHELPVLSVGVETGRPGRRVLRQVDGVHDLVGQTSFPELCELVRNAEIVVGCDSSVCHLAGAYERPTIALFGPTNIAAWKPFGSEILSTTEQPSGQDQIVALHRDMPCSPCIYTGFKLGRPQGCRSRQCMTDLDPEHVNGVASRILERSQGST